MVDSSFSADGMGSDGSKTKRFILYWELNHGFSFEYKYEKKTKSYLGQFMQYLRFKEETLLTYNNFWLKISLTTFGTGANSFTERRVG